MVDLILLENKSNFIKIEAENGTSGGQLGLIVVVYENECIPVSNAVESVITPRCQVSTFYITSSKICNQIKQSKTAFFGFQTKIDLCSVIFCTDT